jgi:hypothetical protein
MAPWVQIGINLIILIIGMAGAYFKMRYDLKKNSDAIADLKIRFDAHEEITPLCMQKFENLRLDLNRLTTEDHMREEYQTQIVTSILQPALKDLVNSMKGYTDSKIGILEAQFTVAQSENKEFRAEIKEYLKDLKNENKESIKQLIDIIKEKK